MQCRGLVAWNHTPTQDALFAGMCGSMHCLQTDACIAGSVVACKRASSPSDLRCAVKLPDAIQVEPVFALQLGSWILRVGSSTVHIACPWGDHRSAVLQLLHTSAH